MYAHKGVCIRLKIIGGHDYHNYDLFWYTKVPLESQYCHGYIKQCENFRFPLNLHFPLFALFLSQSDISVEKWEISERNDKCFGDNDHIAHHKRNSAERNEIYLWSDKFQLKHMSLIIFVADEKLN